MVMNCCEVMGCHKVASKESDKRFSKKYPSRNFSTKDEETRELTTRRRRLWLAPLKLKDRASLSKRKQSGYSNHFVNGMYSFC